MADLDAGQLALLRDIDARKVVGVADTDMVWLDLGDESARVSAGAWRLYGAGLAEPGDTTGEDGLTRWQLTGAGRTVLAEADHG